MTRAPRGNMWHALLCFDLLRFCFAIVCFALLWQPWLSKHFLESHDATYWTRRRYSACRTGDRKQTKSYTIHIRYFFNGSNKSLHWFAALNSKLLNDQSIEVMNRINESNQWIEVRNRSNESNQWSESMNTRTRHLHFAITLYTTHIRWLSKLV